MILNRPLIIFATAATVVVVASVTPAAHAQSTLFKCTDEKGVTHYGETMPAACAKRATTEITKQGNVVRKMDAPLTPEQQKVKDEEDAKKAAETRRVMDQRQKDLALLGTYSVEREFDALRDKDVNQITSRRTFLEARLKESDTKIEKVSNDIAFYTEGKSARNAKAGKEREVPPQLTSELERAKTDRKNVEVEMSRLDVDQKEIVARYAGEKERWKKLKAGMRPGTILDDKGNVLIEGPIIRRQAATSQPR
jgi:hypothetical protein